MKTTCKLAFLTLVVVNVTMAQTPPAFNTTISRSVLNQYFERGAFMDDMGEACYYGIKTPTCFSIDKNVIQNTKPFFIARAATSWDGYDYASFAEEEIIAQEIHNLHTDPDRKIILEGYISEFVTKKISPTYADPFYHIEIPAYVKAAFGVPNNGVTYFDNYEMRYSDVNSNTTYPNKHIWWQGTTIIDGYVPDITKTMTKMWYYYVATQLIQKGYEAIIFGQWFLLNDADNGNSQFWDLLSLIRAYAVNYNRHLVLISGTGTWDCGGFGTDSSPLINNLPYKNYVSGSTTNQLLFDYHTNPASWKEAGYVPNSKSPFYRSAIDPRYERLIKTPDANFLTTTFQFGGIIAQPSWNWTPQEQSSIPFLMHMDIGGGHSADQEGRLEFDNDGIYPPTENNSFLTWGWGGEANFFQFTTLPYRRHLIHSVAKQLRERNPSAFFLETLRAGVSSSFYKFPSTSPYYISPYNYSHQYQSPNQISIITGAKNDETPCSLANTINEVPCFPANLGLKTESQIKDLWDKKYEITFCTPTTYDGEFTELQGYNSPNFPRFLMNVDADNDLDIVGISNNQIKVSKNDGTTFGISSVWGTTYLTASNGWDYNIHTRTLGRFDRTTSGVYDQKYDLIGFGPGGVTVGKSNGTSSFTFSNWTTDFGNTTSTQEWSNTKSVRLIGNVNNDFADDIIAFGNAGVYYALSNGTNAFNTKVLWTSDFGNNGGYSNSKHIRSIADVDGDGDSDIVVFGEGCVFGMKNNNGVLGTLMTLKCDFCYSQGWSVSNHYRTLADIDGDNDLDIIGFGQEGILVSRNDNWVFSDPEFWIYQFGSSTRAGNWTSTNHSRLLADVNGDKMADVIAFGNTGLDIMLTAKSSSDPTQGYFTHIYHYNDFDNLSGWSNNKNIRTAANIWPDAGGLVLGPRSEIVCFGFDEVSFINSCGFIFAHDSEIRDSKYIEESDVIPTESILIELAPNPAQSEIQLTFHRINDSDNIDRVLIVNQFGTVVYQTHVSIPETASLMIPIERLNSGIFSVVFQRKNENIATKRFIKID